MYIHIYIQYIHTYYIHTYTGVDRTFQDPTNEYTVHLLTWRHLQFSSIKEQFTSSWLNSNNGEPRIERIYWICLSQEVHRRYDRTEKAIGNVKRIPRHFPEPDLYVRDRPIGASLPRTGLLCLLHLQPVVSLEQDVLWWGGTRMHLRHDEGLYFLPVSCGGRGRTGSQLSRSLWSTRKPRLIPHT